MITLEKIKQIMDNADWATNVIWGRCTVVVCKLENGFILTETSCCDNEEDYDHDYGVSECMQKIENKIWELEIYREREEEMDGKTKED